MLEGLNWKCIQDEGANKGLEWKFSPAEAPWYNGCCEAVIRSVKRCLTHAIGLQNVTFSEMQIGITCKSIEDGTYLSLNDMLLGRSSNKVPAGDFESTTNSRRRLYFVQRIIDSFWKKWTCDFFPSLLERPKWHHLIRNMKIGDVVKVRRVKVKYVNPSSSIHVEVERPVQRLVMLLAVEECTSSVDNAVL